MKTALITGSAGLIGSEATRFFAAKGFYIVGIDNDMRKYFFGAEASTSWNCEQLKKELGERYTHYDADIQDRSAVEKIVKKYRPEIVIHTAAQPSHDWAAREPYTDFSVNAGGTLVMLESVRQYAPRATFIFTSTNKVYGDRPNYLPLVEKETRFEIADNHVFSQGINESMSIDQTLHSIFGASKVAADVLVQEYGKYFAMNTGVFRGGCLTGPNHSGAQLHGFLAYLVKCVATGTPYTIFGYKGKQVRDNIHAHDLVNMFWHFHQQPRPGEVYNAGGGRESNISMLEAIGVSEKLLGKKAAVTYKDEPRMGDHIWYISDLSKFKSHYPEWALTYDIDAIMNDLCASAHRKGLEQV
ncbi:NAD-dependent epimerase [Candidatus Kaiserbacteria bacterium RIFCSPLOWO2_12_FULL_52_8]|uniref:NAD-dependent epimerase n=1 Tax=Candidatus Kaiserbacteria bacterium RIFCSPHIGHO2_01_FULL_53_31 TaxID=1798481 RepID=A0A1F6CH82_9BACT|nr:MAG: NAD-dependent epimerase [Candidatus Kaiserbacteria bacterium RIFCSPHIGHO2_01_FULL_53_31]OGG93878.1 MAG: NAD-dependent epimerase [Candidatus Kaiserbacteria bacterium RIFCSPLOWO2_12_FULL_52_8]